MLLPTMPAPMITIRWLAGNCLESVVAISLIYQMQVSVVNAAARHLYVAFSGHRRGGRRARPARATA